MLMPARPFLRLVLAALALYAGCHILLLWRRVTRYESIYFQEPLQSIAQKLGDPVERIPCMKDMHGALPDIDAFCAQPDVAEVAVYPACLVPGLCPPILVALDMEAKMMFKSRQRP